MVIKADGLAAGKGVIVAMTLKRSTGRVHDMLAGNAFGDARHRIVIEEFLTGEEASFIVMVDGKMWCRWRPARITNGSVTMTPAEHRRYGRILPAPVVTDTVHQRVMEK